MSQYNTLMNYTLRPKAIHKSKITRILSTNIRTLIHKLFRKHDKLFNKCILIEQASYPFKVGEYVIVDQCQNEKFFSNNMMRTSYMR